MNGLDNLLNVVTGDVAAAQQELAAAREAFLACSSPANERKYDAALMRLHLASAGERPRVDEDPERWDGLS